MSENKDRKDPPVLVDAVAFHLIPDLHRRQCLLAMPKLPERLDFVCKALGATGDGPSRS